MNAIVPISPTRALVSFEAEMASAQTYATKSKAEATQRAYRSDFRIFEAWCQARGLKALPAAPEAVATFLASQADDAAELALSTINRRLASIRFAHKLAGLEPPTNSEMVKETMAGIRRQHGPARQRRPKMPATAERVRAMLDGISTSTLIGLRDRALLAFGFASAMRRSEIVALRIEDIEETNEGLRVQIRMSKTDQEGQGETIAIMRGGVCCPVAAVLAWLAGARIDEGVIFRPVLKGGHAVNATLDGRAVSRVVKKHAERVGLDPDLFGAHSLRSGVLTSAAERGATIWKLKELSRHRSVETLSSYVRRIDLFKDHAAAGLL